MNFSDPVIWGLIGAIVVGFVFLIWAIGRIRNKKEGDSDALLNSLSAPTSVTPTSAPESLSFDIEPPAPKKAAAPFSAPAPSPSAAVPSSVLTPTFSKEVSDRLESMTQRLSEMQVMLTKQSGGPNVATPAAGGIGQGLSPETIDKLLKIIGNVVGQVDILQKSLNISKEPVSAAATPAVAPATSSAAKPASATGSVFTAPPSAAPKINPSPKP